MAKILVGVTGSIACFKSVEMVSQLLKLNHEVQIVATEASFQFIGKATWEALTGRVVSSKVFKLDNPGSMEHIELGKWADVCILAPCSANQLGLLANGFASSLISNIYLAWDFKKSFMIAPAMNPRMWEHKATQFNLEKIKEHGAQIIFPEFGMVACGDEGLGKLPTPEFLVDQVQESLCNDSTVVMNENRMRPQVLVTVGPTFESIDGVRGITNTSSGKTLSLLSERLSDWADVKVLWGKFSQVKPNFSKNTKSEVMSFESSKDLFNLMDHELAHNKYDLVIHGAAVSDYIPNLWNEKESGGRIKKTHLPVDKKLSSLSENPELVFSKNKKYLSEIKKKSMFKDTTVVGFKLIRKTKPDIKNAEQEAVNKLFNEKAVDWVVLNRLEEKSFPGRPFYAYENKKLIKTYKGLDKWAQEFSLDLKKFVSSKLEHKSHNKNFNKSSTVIGSNTEKLGEVL